ncbi:hypothetical protein GVN24_34465 [Rhizobium sp. CRIBSB]|nr:hypothetical protein [Rhizobium sp. CRIBSB]
MAKAVSALAKDLKANMDVSVTAKLAAEVATPNLFGCEGISAKPRSALQTEALSLLANGNAPTVSIALEAAVVSHITSVISETNATLIAEGVSRAERATRIQALRTALSDASAAAVAEYLGQRAPAPRAKIGLGDAIALGPRAPSAKP